MFKESKRARRLRDRARLIARARRIVRGWWGTDPLGNAERDEWVEASARALYDNLKATQCRCCCNPRRWEAGKDRLTMAERRMNESEQNQIAELWDDSSETD